MSRGILGNLFDLDGSGELDWLEQATEISFLQTVLQKEEQDDDDEED